MLQVIIDLTTLEKCGKFKSFEHLISVYNGNGAALGSAVFGRRAMASPWSFRV